MPHVADGELHAWLDGALEGTAPERVAAVAGHLEVCGDCRARLEEARDLRDRTTALLEATAPASAGLPPLEELLARAGAARPARRAREEGRVGGAGRRRPVGLPRRSLLAWAAALLVGAALGWGARTAWRPAPEGRMAAAPDPVVVLRSAQTVEEPSEEPLAERPAARTGPEAEADREVGIERARVAPTTAEAAAERASPEEVWIPVGSELAARWLGGPLLSVGGLPLVDVAVSTSDGERVARLRQRLPSGELLEVRQRPASGAGEPAAEEASATSGEAAAVVDGFEVRLRGPVARDSLRVLLSDLVKGTP